MVTSTVPSLISLCGISLSWTSQVVAEHDLAQDSTVLVVVVIMTKITRPVPAQGAAQCARTSLSWVG
jgi:hypothetical protein